MEFGFDGTYDNENADIADDATLRDGWFSWVGVVCMSFLTLPHTPTHRNVDSDKGTHRDDELTRSALAWPQVDPMRVEAVVRGYAANAAEILPLQRPARTLLPRLLYCMACELLGVSLLGPEVIFSVCTCTKGRVPCSYDLIHDGWGGWEKWCLLDEYNGCVGWINETIFCKCGTKQWLIAGDCTCW